MFSSLNISWLCKHRAGEGPIHYRGSVYCMLCPGQRALASTEAQMLSSSHDLEVKTQIKVIPVLPPHQICHCGS